MSSQRHAPAALFPRNPLVQIKYEAGPQSWSGQFAEETISRRCRDSNSGSEIWGYHRCDHEYSGLLDTSHVRRQSTEVVGILELTNSAAALPGQLLCGDRRINGTLSEQRAEGMTGLWALPGLTSWNVLTSAFGDHVCQRRVGWPEFLFFFFNNQQNALIIQIYSVINSTCFGHLLCPSPGVFYGTFGTGKFHAGFWWPRQDGTPCSSILTLLGSSHHQEFSTVHSALVQ